MKKAHNTRRGRERGLEKIYKPSLTSRQSLSIQPNGSCCWGWHPPRVIARDSKQEPLGTLSICFLLFIRVVTYLDRLSLQADEPRRPNLIVIMADDLGAKELGCHGHPRHNTPRLDALAAEGVRFRTGHAAPVCSPTRVMIMTGRYGFRTGWNNLMLLAYAPRNDSPLFDMVLAGPLQGFLVVTHR